MGPHIWFVAAGTGGHIFPGLSVADEIKRLTEQRASFLFWGDKNRLESKLVPQAGYPISFIRVEQWKGRSFLRRLMALAHIGFSLMHVLWQSFRKRPVALVSVGGYVSVPVALAAKIRKIPVFLIEPNSVSGVANVLVSKWAVAAYTSPVFPDSKTLKCKLVKTGNPVRLGLPSLTVRSHVEKILVLGGSQGALKLSKAAVATAMEFKSLGLNFSWTIQVGEKKLAELTELVDRSNLSGVVRVVPFIKDVNSAYAESDVLISRAGATTLAEVAVVGIPSVLVPFPFAADDHQRINARALSDVGAARMVDEDDKDFEKKLSSNLRDLCASDSGFQKRMAMHLKAKEFGKPEASREIAERILNDKQVNKV